MVRPCRRFCASHWGSRGGFLLLELMVAISVITAVMLPLAYGQWVEANALRRTYQKAVAMEIVDGEFEALTAGEWRQFSEGTHAYAVRARAATNLPPGRFSLTVAGKHLRLEWRPDKGQHGRGIVRETEVP